MSCRGGFSCVSGCEVLRWKSFTAEHALFALSWVGGRSGGVAGFHTEFFQTVLPPSQAHRVRCFYRGEFYNGTLEFFPLQHAKCFVSLHGLKYIL